MLPSATPRWLAALSLSATLLMGRSAAPTTEDGYELWLRYRPIASAPVRAAYAAQLREVIAVSELPTMRLIRAELDRALPAMLGATVGATRATAPATLRDGTLLVGTPASLPFLDALGVLRAIPQLGREGYLIRSVRVDGKRVIVIAAASDVGLLYGTFRFLRLLQTNQPITGLAITSVPRIERRLLDHWDNLDRTVERGYAGRSLWDWSAPVLWQPDSVRARYIDYARANASLGINGTVLTNVNANATVLTAPYIDKVAAIADLFRPYGIRVYLTARFSAPVEIGGLKTADPLDPAVRQWWTTKADELYRAIPDFGGFVVKANSEGQPGPQDYKRTHADGANMLADALASHGGVVMWRAFVYSNTVPRDRIMQAYDEFKPLDGAFRKNVIVQVKNGPLDFQPREPFHPLFGAMPNTPLMMEFQVTKEYLGQDTHLAYLGPLFEEVLRADTYADGRGSTVAKVVDGSLHHYALTGIAGVANIGDDRNWTGSVFNQANWYAYGRLAWDPSLSSRDIADEWIRATFSNESRVVATIRHMMLTSREAVVNYMTPLGLAHIMATGHHYGPAPWVNTGRPDWTPVYYHRADSIGIGFDRTATGSNAVAQYAAPVRDRLANRKSIPDSLLLFFHHVGWDDRLASGRTLWTELVLHYDAGVDSVGAMRRAWSSLRGTVDARRFTEIGELLRIQEREAAWWRDAAVLYFQSISHRPLPPHVLAPARSLEFFESLRCPPDVTKPRCRVIE
jgi:alpha-glucuronidase